MYSELSAGLDPEPRVAHCLAVMYIIHEPLQLDPALLIPPAAPLTLPS